MCGESSNVKKNSNENQVYELAINCIDINNFYLKKILYNTDAKISYNKNISTIDCLLTNLLSHCSGGSKGGARDAPPPVQILSISCTFWEILAKSYIDTPLGSWRPLLGEILDPPLHWIQKNIHVLHLLVIT